MVDRKSYFPFIFYFCYIYLLIECECFKSIDEGHLICSDDFCEAYLAKNPCPELDESCTGEIDSSSGELFPSTTPCNCCKMCIIHLREGEFCSIGAPGAPVPLFFCGPGLQCRRRDNGEDARCWPVSDTACVKEQQHFDEMKVNGKLGQFMARPVCDIDGNYKASKCIPGQMCYCVDKEGNRIFGESVVGANGIAHTNCECSRLSAKLNSIVDSKYPQYSMRCLDDGSFDPLHCMDNRCVCVSSTHGNQIGNPIYLIEDGLNKIPCCECRFHFPPTHTVDRVLHNNNVYLHDCEIIELSHVAELRRYEDKGYHLLPDKIKICDPNGWYSRVQTDGDFQFCSDKFGRRLENFQVPRQSEATENMNCNCARVRDLLKYRNYAELPTCCPNGNFQKIGCRREYCYCIDDNGNQISQEVHEDEMSTLGCFNNGVVC